MRSQDYPIIDTGPYINIIHFDPSKTLPPTDIESVHQQLKDLGDQISLDSNNKVSVDASESRHGFVVARVNRAVSDPYDPVKAVGKISQLLRKIAGIDP